LWVLDFLYFDLDYLDRKSSSNRFEPSLPISWRSFGRFGSPSTFPKRINENFGRRNPEHQSLTVLSIGASDIRKTFANDLPGINASYMKGLHMAFALAIALGGAATLVAAGQPWFRLAVPKSSDDATEEKTTEKAIETPTEKTTEGERDQKTVSAA
jgi:hypothetical protein